MNTKKVVTIGVVLVVLVGGILVLGGKKTGIPTTQPVSTSINTPEASSQPTIVDTVDNVKKITVEGTEFSFSPFTLNFKVGDKIELTFKNTGSIAHDLVIGDLGVSTKLAPPGRSANVTFIASKVGTFPFLCSVGRHKEDGMVGTINIQ